MNLNFTEEQQMLQDSIRRFFEKEFSIDFVRKLQGSASEKHPEKFWDKIGKAGWLGIAIDEKYGGANGTLFDLGIFYEEAGKALPPTSIYSTLFSAYLIEEIGTEEQKSTYLPNIIEGKSVFTIAYQEPNAIHDPKHYTTNTEKSGDRYHLSGTKYFVGNAILAEFMIVISRTENSDGLTAFLVSPQSNGVSIKPHKTFGKDSQSIVELNNVELEEENILGKFDHAEKGLDKAILKATALQTMEMVGGMKKVIQMTVDYVSQRKQFGIPIGSFQAVQHHMANLSTLCDGAELASYQAVSKLSNGQNANREISIAKATASKAYKEITTMAHQLWGGMGYSTESDLYLWSNRAKATELSFGTNSYHLENLVRFIVADTKKVLIGE